MYTLPITTYGDYWRTTKLWSSYLGGALAIWATTSLAGSKPERTMETGMLPASWSTTQTAAVSPVKSALGQETTALKPSGPSMQVMTEYRLADVPVQTEVRESDELPPGMHKVLQEGSPGLKRQVVKLTTVNGNTEEQVIHEFQLNTPKKRVIIENSKPVSGEILDLAKLKVVKSFTVEATAYTYTGNRTATGLNPRVGLIAVDPKVIPLGSRVYVDGYGYAIAADTGGAIRGNKVDVFFPTLRECLDWGRRPVRLYLLAGAD